ncbi:MAG: class I SAM-dependent methyltransferase [Anaerolineales bacterium]
MSITLATTWHPRGELPRFTRLLPLLKQEYATIVISLCPGADPSVIAQLTSGGLAAEPRLTFYLNEDWRAGRYMALQKALETSPDFIHYVDMDRLLRWVETKPGEWRHVLALIPGHDCIIFGRAEQAMLTHPQALLTTEKASNRVVSHFLNMELDVSAGSKSFSQVAAQFLVDQGSPDHSIGTDAEWPILLTRAGFKLEYILVDGLDWESADQFKLHTATPEEQKNAAQEYDSDPAHWARRAEIADEIIQTAFRIAAKEGHTMNKDHNQQHDFNFDAVFEVDDYLYFYSEVLADQRTEAEVSALVTLLQLDQPKVILDLACGFGRHTNRLAALGHSMTGVDLTPGFLEIARRDALQKHLHVDYRQGDMRSMDFDQEFDLVLLLFTAFGYFSDEDNLQVLINVRNALVSGGRLVFDVPNRDTFLKTLPPFYVMEKEGNLMIDRMSFDALQGRSINKRIVIRDGVRKDKPFSIRLYNPNEIRALMAQAGLALEHLYADWDGSELSTESRRMVVIARKP